jgi:hypothetical protein
MKKILSFENFVNESKYPFLREPQKGEPVSYDLTAYHATILDNWKGIQNKGLIPGKSEPAGQSWDPKWKGKATYFHLMFPMHEIENSYNPETGEPFVLVLEVKLKLPPEYLVPDEEVSTDLNYTPRAIKNKEAIAAGYITPTSSFVAAHLVDTPEARDWAKKNVKKLPVKFHKA